ncbi:MAG: sulfatase [Saccharofermentanales bacterium]|jgi:arylsulfatase A-like enzyme
MRAIIVFFDTLNRDYLPQYNPDCGTIAPNFARLAERSVQFDNNYVGSMPCIPARRDVHTGRYNFLHREWGPLEPFDDSMPEILKKNGIYTHLISDHLHYWEDGGATYHSRYSSWEIVRGQAGDHWKGELKDPEVPEVVRVPQRQQGGGIASGWRYDWINRGHIKSEADFPQTQCFDLSCEFIEKNKDYDNWFLHIETFDPHEPFFVPQKYLDMYPTDYDGKLFDWPRGPLQESEEVVQEARRRYQALITMCDRSLGRIMDMMDEYNMWDDTLLLVGTDHGFLLGEHDYWGKNLMPYYNQVAHAPLFIWDPRYGVKGEHRESLVQMIDWTPTLLNFFGQDIPEDVQGSKLDNVITDDESNRDYALFGVFSGHANITDGRYVYMRAPEPDKKDDVYNYTLMPVHMMNRFTPDELRDMELHPPFSFTKGCSVLKIKSKDRYNVARYGTRLYDLENDPKQENPIDDPEIEERMKRLLVKALKENDCPKEQYVRYGLTEE